MGKGLLTAYPSLKCVLENIYPGTEQNPCRVVFVGFCSHISLWCHKPQNITLEQDWSLDRREMQTKILGIVGRRLGVEGSFSVIYGIGVVTKVRIANNRVVSFFNR